MKRQLARRARRKEARHVHRQQGRRARDRQCLCHARGEPRYPRDDDGRSHRPVSGGRRSCLPRRSWSRRRRWRRRLPRSMLRLRGAPRSRRPHHFLHRANAAESEASTLAAAAATVRSALAELQSDAKRARVEEADDEPPPLTNELPCQWGGSAPSARRSSGQRSAAPSPSPRAPSR